MPLSVLVYINTEEWSFIPFVTFFTSAVTVFSYCVFLVIEM